MKVLVTFAVAAEFAPWRKLHTFVPFEVGDQTIYCSQIGDAEVAVLLTGIGPDRAGAAVMSIMMELGSAHRGFDILISSGLAGGLHPDCSSGQILAARCVQSGNVRADLQGDRISCDNVLVRLASDCGAEIVERFYTSNSLVVRAEEKRRLGGFADAVEMESFDVLLEAGAWGARGAAIRAVSDTTHEDLPLDFNKVVTPHGTLSSWRILRELAQSPRRLPALVRFGLKSQRAATALAHFLDAYIGSLASLASRNEAEEMVAAT